MCVDFNCLYDPCMYVRIWSAVPRASLQGTTIGWNSLCAQLGWYHQGPSLVLVAIWAYVDFQEIPNHENMDLQFSRITQFDDIV